MRVCESCHGPGPALWSNKTGLYSCVNCHEDPDDPFFHREKVDAAMHPFGHCTCAGEGTCEWCKETEGMKPESFSYDQLGRPDHDEWCKETEGTILPAFEHYNWLRGVRDSMKIVEDRKRYLQSLGPAATPKPGVIEILDEVLVQLKAMHDRGSYSSSSPMMSPELSSDLKKIKEQVGRWDKK